MTAIKPQGFARLALAIGWSAAFCGTPVQGAPRPLGDFLSAQGTYCDDFDGIPGCDLYFPPEPNMIHWSGPAPEYNLAAIVDYAGLFDNYLVTHGENSVGTTIQGHVNERSLSNGRAEVHVTLHAKNAITYLFEFSDAEPNGTIVYGHPLSDILNGAEPALSSCSVNVTFINTALGASLPDLVQVAFFPNDDQFLQSISISCSGEGALASGGTASFIMRQSGNFRKPDRAKFPVENIALHPHDGKSALEFREVPGQ